MFRFSHRPRGSFALTAVIAAVGAAAAHAQVTPYIDNFDTAASSANYTVRVTPGATGPSGDATFAYNYGAPSTSGGLGIPEAPHSLNTGSIVPTTGLRVRTDNLQNSVGTVVGATEVVTNNLAGLTPNSAFRIQVDVWSNYIGSTSLASSGSNGSTGVTLGAGTAGTSLQYVAGNDGLLVEAFGDNGGGANGAYRVYTDNVSPRPQPTNSPYYAAGTGANSASNTDPYYAQFGNASAPADQQAFSSTTQGGTTPAGTQGFAWHTWTLTGDGTNIVWAIDGLTITTVPASAVTFGGSQVALGNDDTGLTGNTAALNQQLNAEIFDNLIVTPFSVPEPGTLALAGLAIPALLRLRRRKA
jgi:hypothetical protein